MAAFSKIAVPLVTLILASKLAEAAVADLPITNVDVVFTGSPTASLSAATTSAHSAPSITTSSHVHTHSQHGWEFSETPTPHSLTATDLTTSSSSTTPPSYTTLSPEPTAFHKLKDDCIILASGNGAFIEIPLPVNKVSELGAERTYVALPPHFKIVPAYEAHGEAVSKTDHGVKHMTPSSGHTASATHHEMVPTSTDWNPAETAIAARFPPKSLMMGWTDPYSLPVTTSTLPPVEVASMIIPTPTTFVTATSAAATDSESTPVPQTTGVQFEDAGWAPEPTAIAIAFDNRGLYGPVDPITGLPVLDPATGLPIRWNGADGAINVGGGAVADGAVTGDSAGVAAGAVDVAASVVAAGTDLPVIPPMTAEGLEKRDGPVTADEEMPEALSEALRKFFLSRGAMSAITDEAVPQRVRDALEKYVWAGKGLGHGRDLERRALKDLNTPINWEKLFDWFKYDHSHGMSQVEETQESKALIEKLKKWLA